VRGIPLSCFLAGMPCFRLYLASSLKITRLRLGKNIGIFRVSLVNSITQEEPRLKEAISFPNKVGEHLYEEKYIAQLHIHL
jgi:hypothetical protein